MRDEAWIIIDTETNGLTPPICVVEIAAQRMRGWKTEGEPFRVLLNHDVPIEPMAQALHGYSRKFLRENGMEPGEAHRRFREYADDLPLVAYNASFDWDRTLVPEYARLGLPQAGRKGFCAMTLPNQQASSSPHANAWRDNMRGGSSFASIMTRSGPRQRRRKEALPSRLSCNVSTQPKRPCYVPRRGSEGTALTAHAG
jgi:hypothetical protein